MKYDLHNPDNLTPEQIGEGYRLLLKSEVKRRGSPAHKDIEAWNGDQWLNWGWWGDKPDISYRVPLSTWPLPEGEIPWIEWHGGECPLKDEEVEEWSIRFRDCDTVITSEVRPTTMGWLHYGCAGDIIAYRVLKWKEEAPTDNDRWESLLRANSTLEKRVKELENNQFEYCETCGHPLSQCGHLTGSGEPELDCKVCQLRDTINQKDDQIVTATKGIHELQSKLRIALEANKTWIARANQNANDLEAREARIEELQSKLTAAQARLEQLEWRPVSVKPTKEDADPSGYVPTCRADGELSYWRIDQGPGENTHWRPAALPSMPDQSRVEFEEWWDSQGEYPLPVSPDVALRVWKAAREKEERV